MIFRQLFDSVSSTDTYLIGSRAGGEALIIDPVLEKVDSYIKLLEQLEVKLVKVIDTHIHADHISGIAELRDRTNCVTIMGDATKADVVSMRVADNDVIKLEKLELKSLYTPGHTDDSFSFMMNDRIFSGDTLLIRGTGRTDFQNGDPYDSYNSIFERLLKLPENTLLYPAHDYNGNTVSTIGEEKKFNPRLQVNSAEEYVKIMNNLNLSNPKMMDVAVPANQQLGINLERQKKINGLDVDVFNHKIKSAKYQLIDLRENNEIKKIGTIKNSLNIPFQDFLDSIKNNSSKFNKNLLLFCAIGERSTLATQVIRSYDIFNSYHLIGGIKEWIKKEMPVQI